MEDVGSCGMGAGEGERWVFDRCVWVSSNVL